MSDVEKAFTNLHDNVPTWLKDVAELEEKVRLMQDEISKVPVSKSPFMKRKTGSVESIRDLDAIMEEATTSGAGETGQVASRKRKTPSLMSGASGPLKSRTRTMVIVQYDGEIQKSFEKLVRAIGTGRNMLRKGKMAAKMNALAELAGDDDEDDSDSSSDAVMSKIGYRHRAGISSMRSRVAAMRNGGGITGGANAPVELFDSADKSLELAQGLCEKAAHHTLRDGDCRKDLEGVRKHFEEVLETASKEVAKYAARKDQESKENPAEAPKIESTPISMLPKDMNPALSEKHPMPSVPIMSKVMDIEVDDEEEDDVEFTMPPVRLMSRVR